MKKFIPILAAIILASCNNSGNAPTIVDEKYDPSIDSLYAQCENLKGLGNLQIGKTTYRQALKDKGVKTPPILFDTYTNFYNGFWGVASDMDMANYVEKNAKAIKQFCAGKYHIGEIEIDDVCLAFYRDTLVAVSFNCTDEILNMYISKYGNGKGSNYEYTYSRGEYGKDNYFFENKQYEERVWENEQVKMEFKRRWEQKNAPNERKKLYSYKSCVISSKTRYEIFLSVLEESKRAYNAEKEMKKQASINAL